MKQFLTAIIALCLVAGTAIAQPQQKDPKKQAQRIVKALALDNQQVEEFTRVYTLYKDECKAVNEKYPRFKGDFNPDSKADRKKRDEQPAMLPSDEEVEKSILDGFKREKALIDVKEKFYWEFAKFMSPQQIQKIFMMENGPRPGQGQPNGNRPMSPQGGFPGGGPGMGGMTPPTGMW
ncbi:MAG: hypothetical protein II344_01535 [Bacteroidales bacterium]|nr:hypothetical protein [Bacteroidales bacterium]